MKKIGGNIDAVLQTRDGFTRNEIGEKIINWKDTAYLKGYLDYSTGESQYTNYDRKLQESTHVFTCDYCKEADIEAENARLIVKGKRYDVILIDNPMELDYQLEIFLKYSGVQRNGK